MQRRLCESGEIQPFALDFDGGAKWLAGFAQETALDNACDSGLA